MKIQTFFAALALLLLPVATLAETILTVSGTGPDGTRISTDYSAEEIRALPRQSVLTNNNFIDEASSFTGPSLRDLLGEIVIERDSEVLLTALNDYSVTMPGAHILDYNVIAAHDINGVAMTVRDKGPLWVIYPMDEHEELQKPRYNNYLVWQLRSIEVQ